MTAKTAIGAAALVVALLALAAATLRHISRDASGLSGSEADAQGSAPRFGAEREPHKPTARYNVAERTEDGVNVVPHMSAIADQLNEPDAEATDDLIKVGELIAFYSSAFDTIPPGGENVDIVRALTGGNSKRLATIPPGHEALNEQGELIDRWGTPYHFHPISRNLLEVRSAGPDRALFTDDDIVSGGDEDIVVDRPPRLPEVTEES